MSALHSIDYITSDPSIRPTTRMGLYQWILLILAVVASNASITTNAYVTSETLFSENERGMAASEVQSLLEANYQYLFDPQPSIFCDGTSFLK